ncbi:hypothetical protein FA15DRAFT_206389 [Coprinopsis marcescibilis]|uniref:Uncharacterized protein n=1 Tax=Coprinopsis marcescibilis TaxID=230819 RepID=A0A5C3LBV8_COPMA|nr:hypothetical protein FA15DRAFT_206389 [Coprinopsis marcescibilis]
MRVTGKPSLVLTSDDGKQKPAGSWLRAYSGRKCHVNMVHPRYILGQSIGVAARSWTLEAPRFQKRTFEKTRKQPSNRPHRPYPSFTSAMVSDAAKRRGINIKLINPRPRQRLLLSNLDEPIQHHPTAPEHGMLMVSSANDDEEKKAR